MMAMAEELGGTLLIRRSSSGGVFLRLDIPLSLPGAAPGRNEAGRRPSAEDRGDDA